MTTPDERQRAQSETRHFLRELCNRDATPDVPERLRYRAEGLLRHLASAGEVRDMVALTLRFLDVERERDQYKSATFAVTRRLLMRLAVFQAIALLIGILIGLRLHRGC